MKKNICMIDKINKNLIFFIKEIDGILKKISKNRIKKVKRNFSKTFPEFKTFDSFYYCLRFLSNPEDIDDFEVCCLLDFKKELSLKIKSNKILIKELFKVNKDNIKINPSSSYEWGFEDVYKYSSVFYDFLSDKKNDINKSLLNKNLLKDGNVFIINLNLFIENSFYRFFMKNHLINLYKDEFDSYEFDLLFEKIKLLNKEKQKQIIFNYFSDKFLNDFLGSGYEHNIDPNCNFLLSLDNKLYFSKVLTIKEKLLKNKESDLNISQSLSKEDNLNIMNFIQADGFDVSYSSEEYVFYKKNLNLSLGLNKFLTPRKPSKSERDRELSDFINYEESTFVYNNFYFNLN